MAPLARSSRYHAERGHARSFIERGLLQGRDATATSSSSAAPSATSKSSSGPSGISLPPNGAAALVGTIAMLTLLVAGLVGWRVWVWRRKKAQAAAGTSEKSEKHVGLFDGVDEEYGYKRTLSQPVSIIDLPKNAMTRDRTVAEFKVNLGYQPKIVYLAPQAENKQSALPPGIIVSPASSLQISPPSPTAKIPAPSVSPRTVASIAPSTAPPAANNKLPRLVIVESTYTPTLHDELVIREGETLRLLEEYEDEWCLCQRVGPADSEKGVIPRFCIIDKPVNTSRKSKHIPRLSVTKI